MRAQRYQTAQGNGYIRFVNVPSKGSSSFLDTTARYTRSTETMQLADMMDKVFPNEGVPECVNGDDRVFPKDFTVRARAVYNNNDPGYPSLLEPITTCMRKVGMVAPNYPTRYAPPESAITL